MGKISNQYLKEDPYKIIEEGFHPERSQVSESIFSLGNEYSGIRGMFDESSTNLKTLRGSYFNGIYEYAKEDTPSAYKGIVKRTHFMINSVDWISCSLTVGNEKLDLGVSAFKDFIRELDMQSGLLKRSFTWILKDGTNIHVCFERFLAMNDCHKAFQRISLEADKDLILNLSLSLNSNVLHWGSDCYWKDWFKKENHGTYLLGVQTLTTKQQLVSGMKISCADDPLFTFKEEDRKLSVSAPLSLKADKKTTLTRYVVNLADKKGVLTKEEMEDQVSSELSEAFKKGYDSYLEENRIFWAETYSRTDISIQGDEKEQQGIRFCLFQLAQTYHGYSPDDNIGAKGLTGEAYSGHAFWDSETYCLPYYLLSDLKAAKDLLMFRYHTLPQAKKRALDLDCLGACYPIATLNGEEGCNLWQHASLQFQPSTGVAYAIFHYFNLTQDEQFIKDYGLEMLVEISHFLLTRGQWDHSKKHFGFYCVMGPDEFKMMVNNNTYTNFMAKKTFEFTLQMFKKYGNASLLSKCQVDEKFLKGIAQAGAKMLILYDDKTKLFEQHEGYFKLPHLDIDKIPLTDFPLYSHWSYDRIYRYDMIKQPDVLMFMFLYSSLFTKEQKKANYEFYEPRCIHESSLSPSIHSIFAAELGKKTEADRFFSYATRLDLDDYNRNTLEGLHTTSLAAAYMNIVYGFGGVRTDGKMLSLAPCLPSKWQSYSFSFFYRGRKVKVTIEGKKIEIINDGDAFKMKVYDKVMTIYGVKEIKRAA
ncbi:MAG: family 65 glycosyl hydrolase [Bacilli bacterium]|jgi:maltose phosphorylase|nr:family 65 glycosyl hydrolase [Bacilli bacterium]